MVERYPDKVDKTVQFRSGLVGNVVQLGVNAALSRQRSRVQVSSFPFGVVALMGERLFCKQ